MSDDWFKSAVLYQIYPRSFADSSGDGVGDLKGITEHLDYVSDLGVDGIWLSPINTSPMADYGYDISDYLDIDPLFGNLDDFDELIGKAHDLNLKILMDLVPNHTSDQHQWFAESRASLNNPKRDWYVWKDPKPDGSAPNNWASVFGGSAWELDPTTNQYYLHSFLKEQPDLNWANPEVQHAIQEVMRFWYSKGVDGFRVDAVLFIAKDQDYKDIEIPETPEGEEPPSIFSKGFTGYLRQYIDKLTEVCHEYSGRAIFLEAHPDPEESDSTYEAYAKLYKYCDNSVAAPFYFAPMFLASEWSANSFRTAIETFESLKPKDSFSAYVFGNHDEMRIATKTGPAAARTAAMALLTLPGSKVIYYGDELGMADVHIPPSKIQDPSPHNRDPQRTPMQWSNAPHAGFSKHEPWLPVETNYQTHNVETESQNPTSILSLYRSLIQIHHDYPALSDGDYRALKSSHKDVYSYVRSQGTQTLYVILNFSAKQVTIPSPSVSGDIILSTTLELRPLDLTRPFTLQAHEGLIIRA